MFKDLEIPEQLRPYTKAQTIGDFLKVNGANGYIPTIVINQMPLEDSPQAEEIGDIPTGKKLVYAALTLIESTFKTLTLRDHTYDFDPTRGYILHVRAYLDARDNWRIEDWSGVERKLVPAIYNRAKKGTSLGDFQREYGFSPKGFAEKHRMMSYILMGGTVIIKPAGYQQLAKYVEAVLSAPSAEAAAQMRIDAFENAAEGRKTFAMSRSLRSEKPVIEVLKDAGIEKVNAGDMLHFINSDGRKRNVSATENNCALIETYIKNGFSVVK